MPPQVCCHPSPSLEGRSGNIAQHLGSLTGAFRLSVHVVFSFSILSRRRMNGGRLSGVGIVSFMLFAVSTYLADGSYCSGV